MSKALKFEFDFEEVFEGIKLGVIKEMSEATFDDITSSAINQVKNEIINKISLTYKDEYEIRDEIKKEIKEKVYQKLITDIKNEYKNKYEDTFNKDVTNALNLTKEDVIDKIKSETIDKLYNDLYSSIQSQVKSKINNSISELINAITGNSIKVKVKNTKNTISKEEYDELIHRDEILTALENGGVDNWEWYGESLSNYFKTKINNPIIDEVDLIFNVFKKKKINEKIYNEVLDEVFKVLDNFDKYLNDSFQKEDHEPYGKGYDIAIERIRENYFYTKDDIKYLLNRRKEEK